MKIELDSLMINPFTSKLFSMRIMLENLVYAAQIGFFVGIVVATLLVSISLLNLMKDFKKRVIEARRGVFNGFTMSEVEVKEGANFPGFMISCSVGGFVIVCISVTFIFTLLCWPMFWLFLWSVRIVILSIVIPNYFNTVLEGYVQDYVYSELYCKRRSIAGFMDTFYFFTAILGGLGDAIKRYYLSMLALLIS